MLLSQGTATATTNINLSGKWQLDVKNSKFGALPAPVSRTVNIDHRDPLLKLEVNEDTGREKRSQTLEYLTDGTLSVNKVRGSDIRTVTRWEGAILVMETEGVYQGTEFRAIERWSLSGDQRRITIERSAKNKRGETHQTLILEKQ
jgi:hypothetical protein